MINTFKVQIWMKFFSSRFLYCVLCASSNLLHRFTRLDKAGRVRALGIRPTVRGVAMNPCDHPHGVEKAVNHLWLQLKVLEDD
jgi:hypothetical protein